MERSYSTYTFEVLAMNDAEDDAFDVKVVAYNLDDAWAYAQTVAIVYCRKHALRLLSLAWFEEDEGALDIPFEPPFVLDSPLYSLEFAQRN